MLHEYYVMPAQPHQDILRGPGGLEKALKGDYLVSPEGPVKKAVSIALKGFRMSGLSSSHRSNKEYLKWVKDNLNDVNIRRRLISMFKSLEIKPVDLNNFNNKVFKFNYEKINEEDMIRNLEIPPLLYKISKAKVIRKNKN